MTSSYMRGLSHLGSLAISDKDLTRIERVAREMKDNAWALKSSALLEADRIAGKVRGALWVNAAVSAASTAALVIGAIHVARHRGIPS